MKARRFSLLQSGLTLKLIVAFICTSFLLGDVSSADIVYTESARSSDAELVKACTNADGPITVVPNGICFDGVISEATKIVLLRHIYEYPEYTVVVNSPGGEVPAALEIGLAFFELETRLIIYGNCNSSCANYLLPAAFRLVVWDNARVILHGSLPRQAPDYLKLKLGHLLTRIREEGGHDDDIRKSSAVGAALNEAMDEFPEYISTDVAQESAFFATIGPDETYLHRYWEAQRNIYRYAQEQCHPETGFILVVGPEYVNEFRITNVEYFWWPPPQEMVKVAHPKGDRSVVVLDMNLMPSWVPGLGFTSQSDCLKNLDD